MIARSLLRSCILFLLSVPTTVACGGAGGPLTSADNGTEKTGVNSEAVVPATQNLTQSQYTDSLWESETSALVLGTSQHAVAYNSRDIGNGHASGPGFANTCRLNSALAFSYYTNNTWRNARIPILFSGISLQIGDPSVTSYDAGSSWYFYMYSLAMTDQRWNNKLTKLSDGCVDPTQKAFAPDAACISVVSLPKDGSPINGFYQYCFGSNGDLFDGGQIYLTPTGNLYTAIWNTSHDRIDVFKNEVAIPSPFSSGFEGHPLLVRNSSSATMIAPDSNGTFWLSYYAEANAMWSTPVQVASGFNWDAHVFLRNGTALRQIGYDAIWSNSAPGLYFFYAKQDPNNFQVTRLQGVTCLSTCTAQPSWITPAGTNSFSPALALLHTGGGAEQSVLSYWNDNGSANGTVSLTFSNFSGSSFPVSETTASETPCPRGPSGDYWGDYDSMVVHNDGSNGAVLLRYITDSTASACSNGLPQHVSFFVD